MEWGGHLSFGRVPPRELVDALPVLTERFQALRFDPDGRALVAGLPHEGLRLLTGFHGQTEAVYAAVTRSPERNRLGSERVALVSLEENSDTEFALLLAISEGQLTTVHRRASVLNPASPTELQLTSARDLKPNEPGGDMSWNLRLDTTRVNSEIGPAPAILDFMHDSKGMHLQLWLDGATSARFVGTVSELNRFWRLVGNRMSGFYTMVAQAFVRTHLAALEERLESRDPTTTMADLVWSVFVDSLVQKPSAASRSIIEDATDTTS